jgi:hypothetical protein
VSDILAGSLIRTADWPTSVMATDGTSQLNLTTVAFITGTPTVAVTFVAATTGRALLTITAGMRDNTNADRLWLAPEVYLGTDATGTLFLGTSDTTETELVAPGEADDYMYASRTCLLTGLTAGSTYYARIMFRTLSGSGSADIARREITVRPTP